MRLPAKASIQEQALAFMLLEPAAALDDESLTRRALLVAAAYRLHCMHRRGPAPLGTPVEVPRGSLCKWWLQAINGPQPPWTAAGSL